LLIYLEKVSNDSKKKNSSKAVKILASDARIRRILIELKKNQDYSPEQLIHPKYQVLVQVLLEELRNNPDSRILVFVKLRDSVKNIVRNLKGIGNIKALRFVGQSTKAADDKGLSQKKQIEILKQFREGIMVNVLISTNVGEEGLDIAECDLVVFYDVVASEIRLIQRKGRTARHRKGRVIILYCKGTHDDVYLRIALNKLKKMNVNLKNPQQLKDSYEELDSLETSTDSNSINSKKSPEISKRIPIKKKQRHQSNLRAFLKTNNAQEEEGSQEEDSFEVKISKLLPMKFGIRKKLQKDKIEFGIVDSDLHIVIFNRVLIQIYNPKLLLDLEPFTSEVQDFGEICELFIIVFDFIDLNGEKKNLKLKVNEFRKTVDYQIIPIENEEELYFILQSILETISKEE